MAICKDGTDAMSLFFSDGFLSPLEIDQAVTRALMEDLGRAGDITSTATVPEDTPGRVVMVARQAGVISGLPLAAAAFRLISPQIKIEAFARELKHGFQMTAAGVRTPGVHTP